MSPHFNSHAAKNNMEIVTPVQNESFIVFALTISTMLSEPSKPMLQTVESSSAINFEFGLHSSFKAKRKPVLPSQEMLKNQVIFYA